MKQVHILSCSSESWWYAHLIGKTIDVRDEKIGRDYVAADKYSFNEQGERTNTGYLLAEDCQEI